MKINEDYLREFCEHFGVFRNGSLSDVNRAKINYNFGIPTKDLIDIQNYQELKEITNNYSVGKVQSLVDLEQEVEENIFD